MDTQVTFVLDSSGSMSSIRDDTIGGFNTFLEEQRDEPGEASVALYDFNTHVNRVYQGKRINDAPELTEESYVPSGSTALHDAIATAITETDRYIEQLAAPTRPKTVIMVVLTDGMENASETPHKRVQELVEEYQDEHGWEFFFIGANQDAALTAGRMGITADRSLDMAASGEGAREAYAATSRNIAQARRGEEMDGFTAEDQQRQRDAERP
jgi:uncharacterized protein YegL